MPPCPRKRLRRLADIEEHENDGPESVEDTDWGRSRDGDGDWDRGEDEGSAADVELAGPTRRTTRRGGALEGRSTNEDVAGNAKRRVVGAKAKAKDEETKTKGKRAAAGEAKGETRRTKQRKETTGKKQPMRELEIDITGREMSISSQPEKNHKPITSFFGGRSASVFASSQRQLEPSSQLLPVTSKPVSSKTVTSKPIASTQPVILEDLDDLIQDWNSDGIEEDEAEIMGTAVTQTSKGVGSETIKKEVAMGMGGLSRQPIQFQSQPQPKKLPPLFRTSLLLSSLPLKTDSNLPWPQKHAPQSSVGLAIHKRKVEDVSTWLKSVYDGRSRKRVLVLKGPTGSGKTITLEVLAKEGGWSLVEWGNPTGIGGSDTNDGEGWKPGKGESFASAFEDWLFRGGTWGCLDLVNSSGVASSQAPDPNRRKLLLLEDLPNLSHTGTLLAFRTAIRSYLSLSSPPPGSGLPPVPPLVIIISEISEGAGSSTTMGMGVHRIFGPQILSHPLLSEIQFRKVAKTWLVKCLEVITKREGYSSMFEKEILESLAEQGDLRGAISGLEMLALGKGERVSASSGLGKNGTKGGERKKATTTMIGRQLLEILNPRFSTFGIFHSIGKVVYNKRYGDDPADAYHPPPLVPPPGVKNIHRYHSRALKLDANTILDESGVDAGMFIYGVQENYIGSCNQLGGGSKKSLEEILEDVCFCAEALSEGDILLGSYSASGNLSGDLGGGISRSASWGGAGTFGYTGDGGLRQEDIAAQVVVRSMALGLPSPVKRGSFSGNGYSRCGGSGQGDHGSGRGANQMYYPMGLRLWRAKEEIETVVEVWEGRVRDGRGLGGRGDVEQLAVAGLTRAELVLERLPYMAKIARGPKNITGEESGRPPRTPIEINSMKMGSGSTPENHRKTKSADPSPQAKKASQAVIRSLEQATVFGARTAAKAILAELDYDYNNDNDDDSAGISVHVTSDRGAISSLFDLDGDVIDHILIPPPPSAPFSSYPRPNSTPTPTSTSISTTRPPPHPQRPGKLGKTGDHVKDDMVGVLGDGVGGMVLEEDDIEDDDW